MRDQMAVGRFLSCSFLFADVDVFIIKSRGSEPVAIQCSVRQATTNTAIKYCVSRRSWNP